MTKTPSAPTGLSLDVVLHSVVEEYILADLKSMTDEITWKWSGAVCYPMLMAVLAGTELLGTLTGGTATEAVDRYWTEFMSRIKPLYGQLGAVAEDILRNGLMHNYFTKLGVGIVRSIPDIHLTCDETGQILLDCCVLAADFRDSYVMHARDHIRANPEVAQKGVNRIAREATQPRSGKVLAEVDRTLFPATKPTPNVGRISLIYFPSGAVRASQYPG